MGVPKFFRYISERYPCLSEVVKDYQLPEFDNMYLDMNGIIHMCSHPDDNNPHFRITEEKIFQDIFHYLEVLFRMIRPQKLFFMAIDGVAPRAKMNQQRGRRFRSAKDAEKQEADAKKKGETLPTEARFDSNCITPGTVFMSRLHEQLKYFVTCKISNDSLWRDVKVILSGHETPGEGEHKIMDYIRYMRSQPGYDPSTRHCLYGLDADLIMLGLCTHEPHFSLLREEVKFGRKSTKRQSVPEEITFNLLHLSLMREYLELEFMPLKERLVGFEYDFEKIIDDWVLMGFLVGNDFIPHLPNMHITNGALPILYKAYMEVLPTLDGYINESGTLNLARFEKFMQKLGNIDLENFEEIRDDLLYMEAKTGRKYNAHSKVSSGKLLEEFEIDLDSEVELESLEPEKDKPASMDAGLAALIKEADDLCIDSDEGEPGEEDLAFDNYKKEYYRNKLEYSQVTPGVMRDQAEGYVRAIQWNLNYYYNGVCSWSWFYPHHYAPYISDIKGFTDFKIDFELGTPFKPYEQLLGVLPAASKNLLPKAYHDLMTGDDSPLKKYYPEEFQTDLNGKRQEWEAVVLIPFMDEKELLEAMAPCNEKLSPEERSRNKHGPMLVYTYSEEDFGKYEAPEYFPIVKHNHCRMELVSIESIRVPKDKLVKGAYPGASMNRFYPGFPTMKHLKYEAELQKAKVKVFEQPSRYENMIIKIIPDDKRNSDNIPVDLLGTTVYVGWPHLVEARIKALSNSKIKYISMGDSNQYNTEDIEDTNIFKQEYSGVVGRYKNRLGIEVGEVKILCHVELLIGRKYVFSSNGQLSLEKQFTKSVAYYPFQTIVFNINAYEGHQSGYKTIAEVFPEGASCFILCNPYYGSQGIILDSKETLKNGRLKVCVSVSEEPNFDSVRELKEEFSRNYKNLYNASSQLGISHYVYSRITGSIFVSVPDGEGGLKSINIGLDLKFNKKNKETPGYTRKISTTWYYTSKCTELVREYAENFPEVLQYLSENGSNDNINGEAIFDDKWEDKLKELQIWLRNIPTYSLERQPCGSQVTEPEIVQEIEKIVDNMPKTNNSKKVTMQVKPALLYKPEIQNGTLVPDPKMNVQIFDRIVNTRKGYSVPFGLKGTVIAITETPNKNERDTMYDVVFDKPFKDGMQLNCSEGLGYRLPKTSFINISYGIRILEEKTGRQGSLLGMADYQKRQNSWQNSNGQKYFDQLIQENSISRHVPPYQNISDQRQYNPRQFTQHESAFASFNNQSRTIYKNTTPTQIPSSSSPDNISSPSREQTSDKERKVERSTNKNVFMPDFASKPEKERKVERSTPKKVFMPDFDSKPEKERKVERSAPKNGFMPDFDSKPEKEMKAERSTNKNVFMPDFASKPEKEMKVERSTNKNVFMPDFASKPEKQEKTEQTQKKEVLAEIPVNLQNIEINKPKVNTDYLRNLLKIGMRDNKKSTESEDHISPPTLLKKSNSDTGSNVSFEMLAQQVANAPASVRLLTYYQSNSLGIPRYQYFKSDGMYKAQISLMNKELVMGASGNTKEEATENVASEVLQLLIKRAKTSDTLSEPSDTLPEPPKTWVEPQREKSVDRSCDEALKTALHNPFVPTQVIKRQKIKTSSTSSNENSSNRNSLNIEVSHGSKRNEDSERVVEDNKKDKPHINGKNQRKERKPRIAAKFGKKI